MSDRGRGRTGARRAFTALAAAAGLVVVGTLAGAADELGTGAAPSARTAAVVGAEAVCPGALDSTVTIGSVGAGPGTLTVGAPAPGVTPSSGPMVAGRVFAGLDGSGPLRVTATGAVAGGLAVQQLTRVPGGKGRGLGAVTCGAAGTSAWFLGASTLVGSRAFLILVNPDPRAAVVDVTGWALDGPLDPAPGQGLGVPGQSRRVVELDTLAPDRDLLGLHVSTVRGRVAATVHVDRRDGSTPQGTDDLPALLAPARDVLVPGLPAGPGRRSVVLANPTDAAAVARLSLRTGDGLVRLEDVDVPAGSTVARDVTAELAGTPATAVVSSDTPLLAAGLADDSATAAGRVRELAWTGSAEPLGAPALLPALPLPVGTEATLLLGAGRDDAAVDLVPTDLGDTRRVEIAGDRTVAVPLSDLLPRGGGPLQIQLFRGRVVAAVLLVEQTSGGPLTTVLQVRSTVPEVAVPQVRPEPLAGTG